MATNAHRWCNDCATCASYGCDSSFCGLGTVRLFLAFAGIIVACGIGCAVLIALGACLRPRIHNLCAKPGEETSPPWAMGLLPLLLIIVAGGIPQVITQYYSLYDNDISMGDDASSSDPQLRPPCIKTPHSIGLWVSSYHRTLTTDYLSTCPEGTMAPFEAMRATSIVALTASILGCFLLAAFPSPIPAAVLLAVHAVFLSITGAQAEALFVADDFCGSGGSLETLGFEKGAGIQSVWAALAMCCMGAVITVILRCARPDWFAVPEPHPGPQVPNTVTGQVVTVGGATDMAGQAQQPNPPTPQYPPVGGQTPQQQSTYAHQQGHHF